MQVLEPPPAKPLSAAPQLNCSCRQQFSASTSWFSSPGVGPDRRHLGYGDRHCACVSCSMCSASGGSGMAPAVRETANHRFEEGDVIGKGGSCDVYCGVEKGTGKRHALKVLRGEGSSGERCQLLQEASTLTRLNCPHIVRMHGLTQELGAAAPVVVLEHCNGGSLHSFLLEPENARGLEDDLFLILLRDLGEALSYLRGVGLVHRDIKPGNILRHVHHDGRCQFKLSDFGTSREAADTEQMSSIVGTEEYLHPVLYKSAFFGNRSHSTLNPTSGELWSLGCTLYHAMTASVPFKPLGGSRKNRKAMLVMISQKPPGSISGDQRFDGTFRWESAPPSDCRMSESLRQKLTPLLQNLLERDVSRQWTFVTFLDESQRILGMRSFHVCDTECGDLFRLYMEPRQSLAEFQDSLAYHSEVPAGQQLLFHRVNPVLTHMAPQALARDLPCTQQDQPFLLLSPARATEGRCRRQVAAQPELLLAEGTLEEDVTSAFKACRDLYTHLQMTLTIARLPALLFTAILALRNSLTSCQATVETRFRVLSATCQERQSRLAVISQVAEILNPSSSSASSSSSTSSSSTSSSSTSSSSTSSSSSGKPCSMLSEARSVCDELRDSLWQLKYRLDEFRRVGGGGGGGGTSEGASKPDSYLFDCLGQDDSSKPQQHAYNRAKELWHDMQGRREKVPLSPLEQDKHKGDRKAINALCVESTRRTKALHAHKEKLLEHYRTQARQVYGRLVSVQEMDERLLKLKAVSEHFSNLLDQIWRTESERLNKMAEQSQHSTAIPTVIRPLSGKPEVKPSSQLGDLLAEGLPILETFHLSPPPNTGPKEL